MKDFRRVAVIEINDRDVVFVDEVGSIGVFGNEVKRDVFRFGANMDGKVKRIFARVRKQKIDIAVHFERFGGDKLIEITHVGNFSVRWQGNQEISIGDVVK